MSIIAVPCLQAHLSPLLVVAAAVAAADPGAARTAAGRRTTIVEPARRRTAVVEATGRASVVKATRSAVIEPPRRTPIVPSRRSTVVEAPIAPLLALATANLFDLARPADVGVSPLQRQLLLGLPLTHLPATSACTTDSDGLLLLLEQLRRHLERRILRREQETPERDHERRRLRLEEAGERNLHALAVDDLRSQHT